VFSHILSNKLWVKRSGLKVGDVGTPLTKHHSRLGLGENVLKLSNSQAGCSLGRCSGHTKQESYQW
jgi:hypothetical protein